MGAGAFIVASGVYPDKKECCTAIGFRGYPLATYCLHGHIQWLGPQRDMSRLTLSISSSFSTIQKKIVSYINCNAKITFIWANKWTYDSKEFPIKSFSYDLCCYIVEEFNYIQIWTIKNQTKDASLNSMKLLLTFYSKK